jgi:hypothetical protein
VKRSLRLLGPAILVSKMMLVLRCEVRLRPPLPRLASTSEEPERGKVPGDDSAPNLATK